MPLSAKYSEPSAKNQRVSDGSCALCEGRRSETMRRFGGWRRETYVAERHVVLGPDATLDGRRAAAQGGILALGDRADGEPPPTASGVAAVSSAVVVAAQDGVAGGVLHVGREPQPAAQETGREGRAEPSGTAAPASVAAARTGLWRAGIVGGIVAAIEGVHLGGREEE